MHFHAYIPPFLYIHILICVGAFLCKTPSLFLSISCSIAPKRKSTPSQNPLCSGVSSSDSTPSHVRFRDEKAKLDFMKNFSRHGIHSERQVVLSNYSDTNLPTVTYNRGWESLCGNPITCPSVIIQEFYSNLHGFDTLIPHFITRV